MNRLRVHGKYLYDGERKFFARGVSYGTFAPNSRGEGYPEPAQVATDFALMRELGANLVRTYVPPPGWMFELALKHGLRMMVGIPWPSHLAFLDAPEMVRDIRNTIQAGVQQMRQFGEAIFAYSIGNEIPADIVRWHGARPTSRFLAELYDIGKQADPEGLFTYSNFPSAEYLDLGFLDFISFNVYLHREADFRRYLTHLLATTRHHPLVLSETGMDTIREGEAHQAELLAWQGRAAFQMGLAGFVAFAFTDEWYRGGNEILDWAFGLVTRERKPKLAFAAVAEVFQSELPPPLAKLPKASVVVCAYNAAATLGACLESLKHLNYPDYDVIVIDDGSTDATAQIAAAAGARLVKIDHRGLSAARNAGIAAASGPIVAFIDADAEADRDWLDQLVETITRKDAVAAGGQNFPPEHASAIEAAIAAAPGEPREVRAGDDELDQLCGCNMALDKTKLPNVAPFDEMFTTAGDDVDFSWALRERGFKLAYAPGATVIHRRRATIGAYLRQQIGYGQGEAILARKYPNRMKAGGRIYGGDPGWFARWFGAGARVYYGAFGRGLFQSIYRGADLPAALQIPLGIAWPIISLLLILVGAFSRTVFLVTGLTGLVTTIACAIAMAWVAPLSPNYSSVAARIRLAILNLLGMVTRSGARQLPQMRPLFMDLKDPSIVTAARFAWHGRSTIAAPITTDETLVDRFIEALRRALLRRNLAVVVSDGYQPYDLAIGTNAGVGAKLNILSSQDNTPTVGWKLGVRLGVVARWVMWLIGVAGLALVISDFHRSVLVVSIVAIVIVAKATALYALDARLIPPSIESATAEAAEELRQASIGREAGA